MKTIEERAKEYADKESGNIFLTSTDKLYYKMLYEDYIKIATEQKRVDIEKVSEFVKNFMEDVYDEVRFEEISKDTFVNDVINNITSLLEEE